jgi:flagellar hook assembly protein FlgD
MYNLPSACHVRLEVYNVLGQRVATLVNEHQTAGSKVVEWNGKDTVGSDVASGVYFYKIQAGSFIEMRKMILLR